MSNPQPDKPLDFVQPAPSVATPQAPVREAEPKKIIFDTYQGTITRMETHHSRLWEFDFRLDKPMKFEAGQYVSIFLPGKKPAPFSIASSPANTSSIVLGIEIVGEVTGALAKMQPGDAVTLKGPFGHFVMQENEKNVCFLAGGIGITPFICMLRAIRDLNLDKKAVLFYSCKTQDQFMWLDELEAMNIEFPNITIVPTLTQQAPSDWPFKLGRISDAMIKETIPNYKEYVFFTCGPPGLIDAMFALLASMDVPKQNMRREAWH